MIKTVTVEEFDTEILRVGQFITFCDIFKDKDGNVKSGRKTNGIITYIYPNRLIVYTSKNKKRNITLDDIKLGDKRILGVLDDAIIGAPDVPEPIEESEETIIEPTEEGDIEQEKDVEQP